jgi:hypothetical protein
MQTVQQHEIDAQIETAMQVKMRCGYAQAAVIHKLLLNSRRFVLGFNFKQGVNVGDVYTNEDGTRCEVVAIA